MEKSRSKSNGDIVAAILGAAAGGIIVAVGTKAIPAMMSRMMPIMMQNMMARMGGENCDPEEM